MSDATPIPSLFLPSIADWLRGQGASEDVASWAAAYGSDLGALWADCPRADWMLAIAARLKVSPARLQGAARDVVELALDVLPDGDPAPVLLASLADETPEELARLADTTEARSDDTGDPAVAAALLGVASVLRTVLSPEASSMAASLATQALVLDAGACATMSVLGWSQRAGADRVRARLDVAELMAAAQR